MAMTPANLTWHERPEVQRGDRGEMIVRRILESQNCVCYKSITNASHLIDFVVHTSDKKEMFLAEVKTKPRRIKYPDTGFDLRHYDLYKEAGKAHNLRVFVYFVDKSLKQVYGNYLDVLDEPRIVNGRAYPLNWLGNPAIRYYPLSAMNVIAELNDDDLRGL